MLRLEQTSLFPHSIRCGDHSEQRSGMTTMIRLPADVGLPMRYFVFIAKDAQLGNMHIAIMTQRKKSVFQSSTGATIVPEKSRVIGERKASTRHLHASKFNLKRTTTSCF